MIKTSDRIDVEDGIHLTVIDHPDAGSLVKYLNDVEFYNQTCSIPKPYTLEDAKIFITAVLAYEEENGIQRDWAIRQSDGDLIGGIGLLYDYGFQSHRSSMGYWLAKPFWNQGWMTEIVQVFTDFIFEARPLIRLEAMVFEGNNASCRVLEKAGFVKEGYLRKAYFKDGKYIDAHFYGKLRE